MWILLHFIKITCLHQQFDTDICKNHLWNSVFKEQKTLRFHQRPLQFCVFNACYFARITEDVSKSFVQVAGLLQRRWQWENPRALNSHASNCYGKIIYFWHNQFKTPSLTLIVPALLKQIWQSSRQQRGTQQVALYSYLTNYTPLSLFTEYSYSCILSLTDVFYFSDYWKGSLCTVRAMKALRIRGKAPVILNHCNSWIWVISLTLRPFYPRKK